MQIAQQDIGDMETVDGAFMKADTKSSPGRVYPPLKFHVEPKGPMKQPLQVKPLAWLIHSYFRNR
jgi:hypothetical protein